MKTHQAHVVSTRRVINISRKASSIKLKLVGYFVKNVELAIRYYVIAATSITNTTATTTQAKGTKVEISGDVERMLNQIKTHFVHVFC